MRLSRAGLAVLVFMASLVTARPSAQQQHSLKTRSDAGRLVFAHFIVGIVANRQSAGDWDADMQRAKSYGIDAFALNIGTDSYTDEQLQYAYTSAQNNGMKVFISFDFNIWSTGAGTEIGKKVAQFGSLPAQLMVDGKVFVSTFMGDGVDVSAIRSAAGVPIYFAPNFHPSSGMDVSKIDAALNWMGWPNNGHNRAPDAGQTSSVAAGDSQYMSALGSKDYIAPVSPWFFTHYGPEVSYSKNWVFPTDLFWYQRWTDLLKLAPRFIEIVTWNDYGESHYVGPLSSMHVDDGASKWVNDMPHDGFLDMAKPFIAAFKDGASSPNNYITSDQLIYWYRPQPSTVDCDATDTCMTPSSNPDYTVGRPMGYQTMTDNIFVVSLLKSAATVQVNSGGNSQSFNAPAGVSSFSVPMGVGKQQFTVSRSSQTVLSGTSRKDIDGCGCGIYNFNAYVGSLPDSSSDALNGDGFSNFMKGLKVSTCAAKPSLGSATDQPIPTGSAPTAPSSQGANSGSSQATVTSSITSRPIPFGSASTPFPRPTTTFQSAKVNAQVSSTTLTTTTPSVATSTDATQTTLPTDTALCTAGTGPNNYAGLCAFACSYGYCPPGPCTCTGYGTPKSAPPTTDTKGIPLAGLDQSYLGLCSYACNHSYCPPEACQTVQ